MNMFGVLSSPTALTRRGYHIANPAGVENCCELLFSFSFFLGCEVELPERVSVCEDLDAACSADVPNFLRVLVFFVARGLCLGSGPNGNMF